MKRALAMALGAMLVMGSAGSASAASQVDFSGNYIVYAMNHWNETFVDSDGKTHDSFIHHRLRLNFAFHATDEVSVYWRFHAPDSKRFGTGTIIGDNNRGVRVRYAYGEVKQDWGTFSIGRLKPAYGNFGLSTLGWEPGWADGGGWVGPGGVMFDADDDSDGIRWSNRWDNGFQLIAQFNRLNQDTRAGLSGGFTGDTEWSDRFTLEPSYFWDGGGASLGFIYERMRADDGLKAFYLNPAFAHSWGDFSVHFEGKFGWGKYDWGHPVFGLDDKASGYGLYLDFDYNYGPGNVTLAGWWLSGTAWDATKSKSLVDTGGGGWSPLLVAYNGNATGWNRAGSSAVNVANARSGDGFSDANHWAINLQGNHAFTDDVTLGYSLAYLGLNKTGRYFDVDGAHNFGKGIGFEADLGLTVQLLDNLTFGTAFGYLFTGKAFDQFSGFDANGRATFDRAADAYVWHNTLTFSF